MKQRFLKNFVLGVIGLLLTASVAVVAQDAQSSERDTRAVNAAGSIYLISAKAGGINFVSGKVAVARKDAKSGYLLKGDELEIGDKVSTGADGKVEILLNPGSYVRLGENTEFEFVTTSLEDLKVNIKRGSAIFEVIADDDFRVSIATPKADFYAVKSGIYRVDVAQDGAGKIEVWSGRAEVSDGKTGLLKKGQSAIIGSDSSTAATVAKFDRDEKDSLELWSKERAKELAKINSRLDRSSLRTSLLGASTRWSIYDAFGLWIRDASHGFCFLPFGYGWRSPYGYWFGRDLWDMNLPWYVLYPTHQQPQIVDPRGVRNPRVSSTVNTTNPNSNQTDRTPRGGDPADRSSRRVEPPFTRIQREINSERYPVNVDNPSVYQPQPVPVFVPAPNTGARPNKDN